MNKKINYRESRGLPGGPNEQFTYVTGIFSTEGYKRNSPDVNNPFNIIPSGNITMQGVDFPVLGIDNKGTRKLMRPGKNYQFPGDMVFEIPMAQVGQEVMINEGNGVRNIISTNSPQYRKAYKEGRLGVKYDNSIDMGEIKEAVVTPYSPNLARDIMGVFDSGIKTAGELTGLAGTARFIDDPVENLKNTAKLLEKTIVGSSPIASSYFNTKYTPEELRGFFNTLDAAGMAGAILAPAKAPAQAGLRKASRYVSGQIPGSPNAISFVVDDVGKNVLNTPQPWQMQELPGLHLKSTMEGEAISKIVEPKTGLINTEQALAIIGKESGGADKVALIKQGLGDNIPKKMDYNEFRKVVQDQLIPLERQFAIDRSNYGISSLGYPSPKYSSFQSAIQNGENYILQLENQIKNINSLKESPDGGKLLNSLTEELNQAKINLDFNKSMLSKLPLENQTLILGNKFKFGRGSSAHGNPDETLGHIHFLRDAETPDVLTVTQIQSDAFQGTHRTSLKTKEQAKFNYDKQLEYYNKNKEKLEGITQLPDGSYQFADGQKISKGAYDNMFSGIKESLDLSKADLENFTQKQLLDKNHQERYLQELVNYAGERGDVTKLRLPTSETAAKVQGYTPIATAEEIIEKHNKLKGTPEWDEIMLNTPDADKVRLEKILKGEIKGDIYDLERETILKKYSEQPKTIKKLFGTEPKIVTDSKGNTWYEFDIPKKFKQGKGEIKAFELAPFIGGAGAAGYLGARKPQESQTYQKGGEKIKVRSGNTFDDYITNPLINNIAKGFDFADNWLNDKLQFATNSIVNAIYTSPTMPPIAMQMYAAAKPWLAQNIRPVAYPGIFTGVTELTRGMVGNNPPPAKDAQGDYNIAEEAWRKSLGLQTNPKYIVQSKYKPSKAKDPNAEYYTLHKDVIDPKLLIAEAKRRNLQKGQSALIPSLAPYIREGFMPRDEFSQIDPLQNFTIGVGEDKKGKYISIYDKYDFKGPLNSFTTPYEFYDRYYYAEGGEYLNTRKSEESQTYQKGGNVPIYVTDINNPRLKNYNDSLSLYKAYIMQDKLMGPNYDNENTNRRFAPPISDWTIEKLKEGRVKRIFPGLENYGPISEDFQNERDMFEGSFFVTDADKKLINYYKSLGFNDDNIMYHTSADLVHPTIKATGSYHDGLAWSPIYKKPVQPVKYRNPEIVAKQQQLIDAGFDIGEVDGIWGKKSQAAWDEYTKQKEVKQPLVVENKPPVQTIIPRQKPQREYDNSNKPFTFLLGNAAYATYDEATAKDFARDLGIENPQRGLNKNIDSNTGLYREYNKATANKYSQKLKPLENGGELNVYQDYINGMYDGTSGEDKAKKIYDKLNRVYYKSAKELGMTPPNYIMSKLIMI